MEYMAGGDLFAFLKEHRDKGEELSEEVRFCGGKGVVFFFFVFLVPAVATPHTKCGILCVFKNKCDAAGRQKLNSFCTVDLVERSAKYARSAG